MTTGVATQEMRSLPQFKPYPAYKDSHVEWLGKIPKHWNVKRIKYVAPMADERSYALTSDLPYIGLEHIESGTGRLLPNSENASTGAEEAIGATSLFRPGDVLFGKLRPYLAKVLRPEFEGHCSTELLVLRSAGEIVPSVLAYHLLSRDFIDWVDAMTYGAKMPRASPSQVMDIPVAVASREEQHAIASFLDRETARLDALVAKKERLIELVHQKRTALITQAVTKGLKPNAAMKDSGVEWLGEIPAHWDVRRLGQILKDRPRNGVSPPVGPEGITPTFSTAAVNDGVVVIDGNVKYTTISPRDAKPFLVLQGDVLLLRGSGSRALVGKAGIVTSQPPERCIYPDILIRVRPSACLAPWFLVSSVNSAAVRPQIELAAKTAAGIWKITGEDVRDLVVPVPPYAEQLQIETEVSLITVKLEAAMAKVNEAIDRLQELRNALISAAVTGKIDVREAAAS